MNDELYHHGIKGQKWGIRRYQNDDGSLTAAGKARYDDDLAKGKQRLLSAMTSDNKQLYKFEKRKLKDLKLTERALKDVDRSKHRRKLAEHYQAKGMNAEEAAVAAYKRVRMERILAGVTMATIAAAAYRYHDLTTDKILKPGTTIQNISQVSDAGVKDAFYMSYKGMDKQKYLGHYGGLELGGLGIVQPKRDIYKMSAEVNKTMKVASAKSASSVFSELCRTDPEFRKSVEDRVGAQAMGAAIFDENLKRRMILKKGLSAIQNGKIDDANLYKAYEVSLAGGNKDIGVNKFYDALAKKGYHGLVDTHDVSVSGYRSKTPVITFGDSIQRKYNNGINPLSNVKVTKATDNELKKSLVIGGGDIYGRNMAYKIAPTAAGVTMGTAGIRNIRESKIVATYRKDHPGTKLSYDDILRNYYNNGK